MFTQFLTIRAYRPLGMDVIGIDKTNNAAAHMEILRCVEVATANGLEDKFIREKRFDDRGTAGSHAELQSYHSLWRSVQGRLLFPVTDECLEASKRIRNGVSRGVCRFLSMANRFRGINGCNASGAHD